VILLSSLLTASYFSGRQRAFWIGFFATMLTLHLDGPRFSKVGPVFDWTYDFVSNFMTVPSDGLPLRRFDAVASTVQAVVALLLSTLVGYIAAYIYDQSQQDKDG
jgi:hypothetical protein